MKAIATIPLWLVIALQPVRAEIKPDDTLGKEVSVVNGDSRKKIINGGAKRGSFLFHSFLKFNIKKGDSAYFSNPKGVRNIISRVTGNSKSIIDGVLGVNGSANLFFINPNGIVFGKNASLDTGGSFTATTASSLDFKNKYHFSATNPHKVPLLKFNTPSGLTFNQPPAKIEVRGNGHNVTQPGYIVSPIQGAGKSTSGLRVDPGKSISLIAGEIDMIGGLITAQNINLLAIKSGTVGLKEGKLTYRDVKHYGDIILRKQSLLDTSGLVPGTMKVYGENITLKDASLAVSSNRGTGSGGIILFNANNTLKLLGPSKLNPVLDSGIFARGIISQTIEGKGADIKIKSENLIVKESSAIITATFGRDRGGNLYINSDHTLVGGGSKYGEQALGSLIVSTTFSGAKAGDINFQGDTLKLVDGAFLISATFGEGDGGDVRISTSNLVVDGGIPIYDKKTFIPSAIASTSTSAGNAGNLKIKTDNLLIKNGGRVDSSTFARGSAGSIGINAKNITVTGAAPGFLKSLNPSNINSSGSSITAFFGNILNIDLELTGKAGNINIKTDTLNLENGGTITVANAGTGRAGSINLDSRILNLDDGTITASNKGGGGGSINLDSDAILLRDSNIKASSEGGNGGNIEINSHLLSGDNASKISANSEGGNGGNIEIDSESIDFNVDRITASSDLGKRFDGSIQINSSNFSVEPQKNLKISPVTSLPLIGCKSSQENASLVQRQIIQIPQGIEAPLENIQELTNYKSPLQYLDLKTQSQILLPEELTGWQDNNDGTVNAISQSNPSLNLYAQGCNEK